MPENCFNNAYMGHEGSHLFFKGGNSDKRLSSSWGFHMSPSYLPIRKAEVQCRVNIKVSSKDIFPPWCGCAYLAEMEGEAWRGFCVHLKSQ